MPSVPFYSGGIRCASCLGWLCRPATLRFAQSVFAAYTPPQKTDLTSFAPLRRRELCETLGDILLTVRTSLAAPSGRGGRAQRGWRGETMTIAKDNTQLENARRLRREMTPHERKLWYLFLRRYPVKIYKQRIIGRFIVDFYCASARLVIELDGSQHYEPQGLAYDAERSQFLMSLGLEILRFSNRDIDKDFRGVCAQIDLIIRKRLQGPLSHLR